MKPLVLAIGVGIAGSAFSQSINIDLGSPGSAPGFTYGGAGWPGTWNDLGITGSFVRVPVVGLDGQAVSARYYQTGLSSILDFNMPGTLNDDEKLVDDMALSTNSPVDGCVWVENLLPGNYDVIIYAITPNNSALMSRTRVDFTTPPEIFVGGSWPSTGHANGITYSRFNVQTTGTIGLHSGLFGGNIQSGINGLQLIYNDGPLMRVYATSSTVESGLPFGGDISTLHNDDDQKLFILNDSDTPNGALAVQALFPDASPSQFRFELVTAASRNDLSLFVELKNASTGSYEVVTTATSSLADQSVQATPSGNLSRFVGQGLTEARIRWVPQTDLEAADGWLASIDRATWMAKP